MHVLGVAWFPLRYVCWLSWNCWCGFWVFGGLFHWFLDIVSRYFDVLFWTYWMHLSNWFSCWAWNDYLNFVNFINLPIYCCGCCLTWIGVVVTSPLCCSMLTADGGGGHTMFMRGIVSLKMCFVSMFLYKGVRYLKIAGSVAYLFAQWLTLFYEMW